MNRIELLRMATDSHRHREIERACGTIAAVQALVTEVVAQDTKVRRGFLLIAGTVGIGHTLRNGSRVTHRIAIAPGSEEHRKIVADILLSPDPLYGIATTFYEGYSSIEELYTNSTIVHHEKEVGGYVPDLLNQYDRQSMSGDMRRRVADDVTLAENQAKRAKETQAMLWQAMSDPELNPDLAANIALRRIQGPDIS